MVYELYILVRIRTIAILSIFFTERKENNILQRIWLAPVLFLFTVDGCTFGSSQYLLVTSSKHANCFGLLCAIWVDARTIWLKLIPWLEREAQ